METLKDIFVPYEIAVQLKEIGFDEKCIASYTSAKNIIFELYDLTRHAFKEDLIIDDFNSSDRCISAPSYEQVKKWFREKEIDGDIRISYPAVNNYHFKIVDFREAMEYRSEIFNNYEEARGQLILKLIGIYKNEQDI